MLSLKVKNFRGLRSIDWTIPQGVSALVGPNGSGKSTLLGVLEVLKLALKRGIVAALELRGGLWGVQTLGTSDEESVGFTLTDSQLKHEYVVQFVLGDSVLADEWLTLGDLSYQKSAHSALINKATNARHLIRRDDKRLLPLLAADLNPAVDFELVRRIESFRLYDRYLLDSLRKNGSELSSDYSLAKNGKNVFSVLKNWLGGTREHKARYKFVCDGLKDAFPDVFEDFEFQTAGQVISAGIIPPTSEYSVPCYFAPMGFWVAMLHLTGVASCSDRSVVAFDGFENELHPFAVRSLIDSISGWADLHELSIVLATHSPVVLDQFKADDADRVFVMEPSEAVLPVALSKLCNREWLAQFAYGDLYAHERFGAPRAK